MSTAAYTPTHIQAHPIQMDTHNGVKYHAHTIITVNTLVVDSIVDVTDLDFAAIRFASVRVYL